MSTKKDSRRFLLELLGGTDAGSFVMETEDGEMLKLTDLRVVGYLRGIRPRDPERMVESLHITHAFTLETPDGTRVDLCLWGEPA